MVSIGPPVEVFWHDQRVQKLLRKTRPALTEGVRAAYQLAGEDWKSKLIRRFRSDADSLNTRTGLLRNSTNFRIVGNSLEDMRFVGFNTARYAATQEYGARIKARNKWLTIPGPAAKRGSGTLKPSAQEGFRAWMQAFKKKGTVFIAGDKNNFQKSRPVFFTPGKGKSNKEPELWWILARAVTIPGPRTTGTKSRFGFLDTWKALEKRRAKMIAVQVGKSVRKQAEAS